MISPLLKTVKEQKLTIEALQSHCLNLSIKIAQTENKLAMALSELETYKESEQILDEALKELEFSCTNG